MVNPSVSRRFPHCAGIFGPPAWSRPSPTGIHPGRKRPPRKGHAGPDSFRHGALVCQALKARHYLCTGYAQVRSIMQINLIYRMCFLWHERGAGRTGNRTGSGHRTCTGDRTGTRTWTWGRDAAGAAQAWPGLSGRAAWPAERGLCRDVFRRHVFRRHVFRRRVRQRWGDPSGHGRRRRRGQGDTGAGTLGWSGHPRVRNACRFRTPRGSGPLRDSSP